MASGGSPSSGGPYKQKEALVLLGDIDYKTFVEWCRKAKPPVEPLDPEKHPKLKIDRRAMWYSRSSLERLASLHGIGLLADGELQVRPTESGVSERMEQLAQSVERGRLTVSQLKDELLSAVRQEVQLQLQMREELISPALMEQLRREVAQQVAIAVQPLRQEFLEKLPSESDRQNEHPEE